VENCSLIGFQNLEKREIAEPIEFKKGITYHRGKRLRGFRVVWYEKEQIYKMLMPLSFS
jgi:hypothetical protein